MCIQENSKYVLVVVFFAWTKELYVSLPSVQNSYCWTYFSKLVGEMVKFWRSLGHKIVMFLDDSIGGDSCLR